MELYLLSGVDLIAQVVFDAVALPHLQPALGRQGPYFIFLKGQEYPPFLPTPNDMIQYWLIGCFTQDQDMKSLEKGGVEAFDYGDHDAKAQKGFQWCENSRKVSTVATQCLTNEGVGISPADPSLWLAMEYLGFWSS